MAIDAFGEEARPKKPAVHEVGSDLGSLSIAELDERVAILTAEVERIRAMRDSKEASREAAGAFFR